MLGIGESNPVAQTQSFADTLLPTFSELAKTTKILDTEALKRHPLIASIGLHVRSAMQNTRVVKVKFYDTQGRTIFSTDATQIGRDYRDNAGFISALEGHPLSELTHRDRFSAFDREIVDRDVLSSYVAMRAANDAPIEGVLEVYSDVTDWIEHTNRQAVIVTPATILAFSLLYATLFIIVLRADGLIRTQYRQIKESKFRVAATAFESQEAMMVTDVLSAGNMHFPSSRCRQRQASSQGSELGASGHHPRLRAELDALYTLAVSPFVGTCRP